ncbi:hypothetical protein ANO11243_067980 [Dothideomycetidae sp. 11243]|nr:hypothetical protein ANO11243_067980 [fungal sp. No.11243]
MHTRGVMSAAGAALHKSSADDIAACLSDKIHPLRYSALRPSPLSFLLRPWQPSSVSLHTINSRRPPSAHTSVGSDSSSGARAHHKHIPHKIRIPDRKEGSSSPFSPARKIYDRTPYPRAKGLTLPPTRHGPTLCLQISAAGGFSSVDVRIGQAEGPE